MDEREYSIGDYIVGSVFLIWFLGSMGAFVLTARTTPWLSLAVFGQIFTVVGILALVSGLKEGDYKPIMLLFIFVGLVTITGGIIMQYGEEALQERFMGYIPYIGMSIFFVTGILALVTAYVRNRREQKCTQLVKATCIEIKRRKSNTVDKHDLGKPMYYLSCPVFRYFYNGRMYERSNNTFTRYCNVELRQTYDLYINPDKPEHFREEGETARLNGMEVTVGIMFTLISIVGFILIIVLG